LLLIILICVSSSSVSFEKGKAVTIPVGLQVLRILDLLYTMDIFKIQEQISPIELDQQRRQRVSKEVGVQEQLSQKYLVLISQS